MMYKKYRSLVLGMLPSFAMVAHAATTVHAEQSVVTNPMLSMSAPYIVLHVAPAQIKSASARMSSAQGQDAQGDQNWHTAKKEKPTGKINVNTASETQLIALPGIGPAKAHAIAQYRQLQGRFKTVDDLSNVNGIGPKTLEKLRPYVGL